MDKFLQDLLDNLNEQRQALREGITSAETLEERQALMDSLDQVDEQIRATETQLRSLPEDNQDPLDGTNAQARGFNPLATFRQNGQIQQARANEVTDQFDTVEYRTAFMEYACRGVPIPANLTQRADAVTMTSDVGAVIPTTIMNEIVKELKVRGGIWAKVRKLNVQGGVEIPILSLKPKATWVAENKKADSQKLSANDKISFSYYGLECKVSQSLLANVTSFDLQILIPLAFMGVGILLGIVASSKITGYCLKHFHNITIYFILGLVIASSIVLIPLDATYDMMMIISCFITMLVGGIIVVMLEKLA